MQRLNIVSRIAGTRAFAATTAALYPITGKCISWVAGRGFGFVEDGDKKQHFVHNSAIKVEEGGYRSMAVGQDVEFDVSEQDGRTRAENVTGPNGSALPSGERPPQQEGGFRGRGGGRGGGGGYRGGGGGGGGGYRGGGGGGGGRGGQQNYNDDF